MSSFALLTPTMLVLLMVEALLVVIPVAVTDASVSSVSLSRRLVTSVDTAAEATELAAAADTLFCAFFFTGVTIATYRKRAPVRATAWG